MKGDVRKKQKQKWRLQRQNHYKKKRTRCFHGGILNLHRFNDKLFKEHAEQIKSFHSQTE